MTIIVVDIDDELNKELRKMIIDKLGNRKGALRDVIEEAIRLWLRAQKQ